MKTKSIRGVRRSVVGFATVVFVMALVVVLPPATADDAPAHTYTVWPTGGDDTANIQAAFDACIASGAKCTVQLAKGTFHTAQIVAYGFQGNFRGSGERWTVVEALPDLPVTSLALDGFNLPSRDHPWPDLFSFIDGAFTISDMTISEPHAVPTQGWTPTSSPGSWFHALYAFVFVTGTHADAAVDHVTLVGGPGDSWTGLYNAMKGISIEGLAVVPGSTDPLDVVPLEGDFSVTNSAFRTIEEEVVFAVLVDTHVTVKGCTFDDTFAAAIYNQISRGVLEFSDNVVRNAVDPVITIQGYWVYNTWHCQETSRLLVARNELHTADNGNAVSHQDFGGIFGCSERTMDAIVAHNVIYGDGTTDAWGVVGLWARSTIVVENEFRDVAAGVYITDGPGLVMGNEIRTSSVRGVGVWLDATSGVLVRNNEIRDSASFGIALTAGSSGNVIRNNEIKDSGAYDLYWDQTGGGNVWKNNECRTSDPPGLCVGH